ncbi:histidine kinase [Rhodanobacter sp. Root480]|jgi:CBS domain-containing protein|uniref:Signal transduction protein n=2 Tax=Rhodanobacter TaxID=75309 RepID=I4VU08_9GAMM|nr:MULTISPECIES: CBS domain-containing protein [Rhodanobacter]EIL90699.1 signal transduction protein [Rhodanobacter fulvus Jip2]KQX95219.1 histidine kinase [Rhodanobacter sp. Root480]KRA30223.1 histidine kinase [Rhodanobacter sp. Root627]HUH54394.1 CBS domain-containing protein [Rhodanobacter sp.]
MRQVKHLLEGKGNKIFSIEPDVPVLEAIKRMAEYRIGALMVMRGSALVGVMSERDYARKVLLQGRSSSQTAVSDIMSGTPITVSPDTDVFDCMRLCTDSRIRHLPVVDGEQVVGVISIGDLVKAVIDAQAEEIEHLQRYITS